MGIVDLFHNAPLHTDRWIGTTFFMTPILIVYVLFMLKQKIKGKFIFSTLIYLFILLLLQNTLANTVINQDYRGIYIDTDRSNFSEILDFFKDKEGLIMVETTTQNSEPVDKVLNAYLGAQGNRTIYTIIRESALSALVYTHIRNSLSDKVECWGIRCKLSSDKVYLDADFEQHINTAIDYGLEYFVIRTFNQKELFDDADEVELVTSIRGWNIYKSLRSESEIDLDKIFLVFSDIKSKKDIGLTDYFSLVENINIRLGNTDIVFAYSNRKNIEDIDNYSNFQYVIFDNYKYKDLDVAKNVIDKILENNTTIIAAESPLPNELYYYLKKLSTSNKNVSILSEILDLDIPVDLQNIKVDEIKYQALEKDFHVELSNTLNEITANKEKGRNGTFNSKYTVFNQSYFPAWKSASGNEVMMISPTRQMVFGDKIENYFSVTKIVYLSHIVSLLTLLLVGIISIVDYRSKN
jgi:hypothetical protein